MIFFIDKKLLFSQCPVSKQRTIFLNPLTSFLLLLLFIKKKKKKERKVSGEPQE